MDEFVQVGLIGDGGLAGLGDKPLVFSEAVVERTGQ